MPKTSTAEESKLTLNIKEAASAGDEKTPVSSPRLTRAAAAAAAATMTTELGLNTLFKFIKSYDGSRETVNSFIINCNNAYELATEPQKPILLKYILSQLQGKAELACSIKEFSSWDQLKEFLKTQFCERKHYAHLLTDLQECKQGPQDNVNQFSLRIETYLSQLLTEITLSNTKVKELAGRVAAMEDLALHHFLMGLHPRISNIVRCRSPRTLNEAINMAISEERIQQSLYRRPTTEIKPKPKPGPQRANVQYAPVPQVKTGSDTPFCRYCKSTGHEIKDCVKREFYNSKFQSKPNYQQNNNFRGNKVNHVREASEEEHDLFVDEDYPAQDDLNETTSREGAARDNL